MNQKRLTLIQENLSTYKAELIEALKEINKEKSFREMGEILGTNHAHLNRIVTGKQDATIEKLLEYVLKL